MKQKCGWEVERDQEGVKDGDDYGKRHQKLIVFGKKNIECYHYKCYLNSEVKSEINFSKHCSILANHS